MGGGTTSIRKTIGLDHEPSTEYRHRKRQEKKHLRHVIECIKQNQQNITMNMKGSRVLKNVTHIQSQNSKIAENKLDKKQENQFLN